MTGWLGELVALAMATLTTAALTMAGVSLDGPLCAVQAWVSAFIYLGLYTDYGGAHHLSRVSCFSSSVIARTCEGGRQPVSIDSE